MRWIEIIEIRSLSNEEVLLELDLPALLGELGKETEPERIAMYRHGELKTDWGIHLQYASDSGEPIRSSLGARLVSVLREFGLVHHSIWKEVEMLESPDGRVIRE